MVWTALRYLQCVTIRYGADYWSQVGVKEFLGRSSAIEFKYRGICLRPAYIYSTRPFPPCGAEKRGLRFFLSLGLAFLARRSALWAWRAGSRDSGGGELLHLSSLGIDDRLLFRFRPFSWPLIDMCFFVVLCFLKKRPCSVCLLNSFQRG